MTGKWASDMEETDLRAGRSWYKVLETGIYCHQEKGIPIGRSDGELEERIYSGKPDGYRKTAYIGEKSDGRLGKRHAWGSWIGHWKRSKLGVYVLRLRVMD